MMVVKPKKHNKIPENCFTDNFSSPKIEPIKEAMIGFDDEIGVGIAAPIL